MNATSLDQGDSPCASLIIELDETLFSPDAVKRAAYRFTDRASFGFERVNGQLRCTLLFAPSVSAGEAEAISNDFRIEVLDQELRSTIAAETEPVRNAILAYAFSRTGLQG